MRVVWQLNNVYVVHMLFMMVVRERINELIEESGMLGDIQGGSRSGRMIDNNLFILERMWSTSIVRKIM